MQRGCANNLGFSNLFYICSFLLILQYLNVVCNFAHCGDYSYQFSSILLSDGSTTTTTKTTLNTQPPALKQLLAYRIAAGHQTHTSAASTLLADVSTVKIDLTKHHLNSR